MRGPIINKEKKRDGNLWTLSGLWTGINRKQDIVFHRSASAYQLQEAVFLWQFGWNFRVSPMVFLVTLKFWKVYCWLWREKKSHSVLSDPLQPHGLWPARLLCPWDSPGKNTGVGSHSLLQRIFPMQGSNLGLLLCRQILYHLSHQGRPLLTLVAQNILSQFTNSYV